MARRFIPIFLDEAAKMHQEWRDNGEQDMVHESLKLLVKILAQIIFGDDFYYNFPEVMIEDNNGKSVEMGFFEAYDFVVL